MTQYIKLGELISKAKVERCGENKYPVLSMTMHNGLMFQSERFDKQIASQDCSKYLVVKRNQLVEGFPIDEAVLSAQTITDIGIVSPAYKIWDIKTEKIVPEYLERALRSERSIQYYKGKLRGSTARRRTISDENFLNLEIRFRKLEDQKKIIEILNKVHNVLSKKKAKLENLDKLVKARFVEMFGNIGRDDRGWGLSSLGKACIINPRRPKNINKNGIYSFISMPSVSEHGDMDSSGHKSYEEVKTGFTYFQENDVLFAKITPCMENGKGAVARGLKNGIGFGSTEFHVLRPIDDISNPYWLYEITMQPQFRISAERQMTGTGGQRRVPVAFLENFPISIPPITFQNKFADFVQQVDKSKAVIQESIDKTQMLFDSLMQEYFS